MPDPQELDQTFHFIMQSFVERGQGPHFTEIAKAFALTPQQGRQRLRDLMAVGIPAWLHPGTDLIASFAPFNNLPTQYRITVDGAQKWFAQCALESMAMCWAFPGKLVQVDANCLQSGDPLHLEIRDGVIERADPPGMCGYIVVPYRDWRKDSAFA